jgi:hypothetical protein
MPLRGCRMSIRMCLMLVPCGPSPSRGEPPGSPQQATVAFVQHRPRLESQRRLTRGSVDANAVDSRQATRHSQREQTHALEAAPKGGHGTGLPQTGCYKGFLCSFVPARSRPLPQPQTGAQPKARQTTTVALPLCTPDPEKSDVIT